jgi:hypothetical protein
LISQRIHKFNYDIKFQAKSFFKLILRNVETANKNVTFVVKVSIIKKFQWGKKRNICEMLRFLLLNILNFLLFTGRQWGYLISFNKNTAINVFWKNQKPTEDISRISRKYLKQIKK